MEVAGGDDAAVPRCSEGRRRPLWPCHDLDTMVTVFSRVRFALRGPLSSPAARRGWESASAGSLRWMPSACDAAQPLSPKSPNADNRGPWPSTRTRRTRSRTPTFSSALRRHRRPVSPASSRNQVSCRPWHHPTQPMPTHAANPPGPRAAAEWAKPDLTIPILHHRQTGANGMVVRSAESHFGWTRKICRRR